MELSGSDLMLIITSGTASLVGIIMAVQKSKCSSINVCWNCIKCIRTPEFNNKDSEEKDNNIV
jgi:hypothetical protein